MADQAKPFEHAFFKGAIIVAIGLIIVWLFLSVLEAMIRTFSSMAVGIAVGIMIGAVLMHYYHAKIVTP